MVNFTTEDFLKDYFTDADGIIGLVGKYWVATPGREAARKWFSRGSVSAEWWPVLLYTLECHTGAPVSLTPYMRGLDDAQHNIFE